jgi:acyl dehydratase
MTYTAKGKHFDEFEAGASFTTAARTVTEADIMTFAGLSGDFNPLHTDETFARTTPFGTRIAHGMLVASIATGLANQSGLFEGTTIALLSQSIRYQSATRPGDTIRLELTVREKKETKKPDRGIITFQTVVKNQKDEALLDGEWTLMMSRKV